MMVIKLIKKATLIPLISPNMRCDEYGLLLQNIVCIYIQSSDKHQTIMKENNEIFKHVRAMTQ